MYLLTSINNTCSDAALARGISIIYTVIQWISIIVPIILIVSLVVSLISMTVDPNQKDGQKKIIRKVASALIIFLVPSLLGVVMSFLNYATDEKSEIFNFTTCYKVALQTNENIGVGEYNSGAGTSKGNGLNLYGDLSGLSQYVKKETDDTSSSASLGDGGILIVAGHSYSPYCAQFRNECREEDWTYVEPTETRKLAKLLKNELDGMNLKASIANEMLGGTDAKMNKSLFIEMGLNTQAFQENEPKFKKFTHVIEFHFNAAGSGAHGTVLMKGQAGISKIDNEIKAAVVKYTGRGLDDMAMGLQNQRYFQNLGIPMTYLEVEFYDNNSAMAKYETNKEKIAHEIALVFQKNYGDKISR